MEQLESKIINDIANSKNQQANELKFNLENLKAKLESLSRIVDDHDR